MGWHLLAGVAYLADLAGLYALIDRAFGRLAERWARRSETPRCRRRSM